jgi:predicted permease
VTAALPLFGAFLIGLGSRRWLQRHVSFLVRAQLAGGIGVLAVLSGWSFHVSVGSVSAILILLVAQLTAVAAGSWLFRRSGDGPLVAFGMYGNPTFWSLPVATATLGAKAAVFLVAYDMLTQPRIALAIRFLRVRAPIAQQSRTALADYAPTIGAVSGLILGRFIPAPEFMSTVVAALGIAMAIVGALLLGVAWPKSFLGRAQSGLALRGLALHFTLVPALLALATLAGIDLPGAVWILALGPIPTSVVGFAQVYGYSARTAASGLALSLAAALVLAPWALALAR